MPRPFAVAVVLAGALLLTACGGDSEAGGTTPGASAAACTPAPAGADGVAFEGVTVTNPTDLKSKPESSSCATSTPAELAYKDLVVGKGEEADPESTVTVHYQGFLYKDGTQFDSSWDRGEPIEFPLTGVVPGFTQGIGGTADVPPMKTGGRRIMILPPALGYPDGTPDGSIPANSPIVFIVDLVSIA